MRSLLQTTLLLALLPGCAIHEPVHQIIYTPDKHLTNNQVSGLPQLPFEANQSPAIASLREGRVAEVLH